MQLKGYAKSNHKVGIFVVIILAIALVLMCTSFAFYNREVNHVFISSTVGNFNEHDIKLAILVDGESNQDFPSKGNYDVDVDCGTNAIGEWHYKEWSLELKNMNGKSVTCSLEFTSISTFGIKREIATSSSAWERTDAAIGKVANAQVGTTAVVNDFDNIYPWSEIKTYNYDTDQKETIAWYGDADFTFTPSGNVEVLTYIPEFYYKRYQEDDYEYIQISKYAKEGYTKSDAFSIGRYTMSGDEDRVHSRSGIVPLTNHNITEFRGYARNLGSGFGQLDYHYFIIQLLYLVEYADYNSQDKLGPGYTNSSNTEAIASGGCNSLGMHSGSADGTNTSSVIYRGIEDVFGNVWQFVDGINIQDNQAYINYNPRTYQSDIFSGDYQQLGYMNDNNDNYISKLGYDANHQLIAFPTESIGSDSTYIPDYYKQNSTNRIARVGGAWTHANAAGLWCWTLIDVASSTYGSYGARLLKTS